MKKSLRDPKRRPTHPGAILREDVLPALGMTQGNFAAALGDPLDQHSARDPAAILG